MIIYENISMPNVAQMMRKGFFDLAGKRMPEKYELSGPKIKDLTKNTPFLITSPFMALEIVPCSMGGLKIMRDGKLLPLNYFEINMATYNNYAFFGSNSKYNVMPTVVCDALTEINALPERLRPKRMGLGTILFSQLDPGEHAASVFLVQNAPAATWIFAFDIFQREAFSGLEHLPQSYIEFLTDRSRNMLEKIGLLSDIVCAQTLLTFEMAFEAKYLDTKMLVFEDDGTAMYKFDFAEKIRMVLKPQEIK